MKRIKYIFCAVMAYVAFITLGERVFAEEAEGTKIFIATYRVMDGRPEGSQPSAEQIRNRFQIKVSELLDPADAELQPMGGGLVGKILGKVTGNSKLGVFYDGKPVALSAAPIVVLKDGSYTREWKSPEGIAFGLGLVMHPSRDTEGVQLGELLIGICGEKCE